MLTITSKIIKAVIDQAENELPFEACGYLAGDGDIVTTHFPLKNIDQASDHFTMDPAEQFQAVKAMRQAGLKLCAVYHSHPETPARPSDEDLKLAYDPTISYVIISMAAADPVVKSFIIKNGEATPEPIQIKEYKNQGIMK
ncbi:MAG: M67 family metallopeptidase [Desulfobulbaceae bacterium]|nr:M67 family metallopeptidase [Desulfobulbaceae bacterium]